MYESSLAKKYASALFDVSSKDAKEDLIYNELKYIQASLENESIKKIFLDRRISKTARINFFNKLFKTKVSEICLQFFELLMNKKREKIFGSIIECYYQLLLQSKNILPVEVLSAFELEEKEIKMLKDKLLDITGAKDLKINFNVDGSLIGGLSVKIKDEVYDGTISNKLKEVKELLLK